MRSVTAITMIKFDVPTSDPRDESRPLGKHRMDQVSGLVCALSRMGEVRDPYTATHQNNVGVLGAAIAIEMGIDEEMALLIEYSGRLHDVGKVAVPSEILTRPGRFSSVEFEVVKGHAEIGGQILAEASLPWPIADVAL